VGWYGISPATVQKWRKRTHASDAPMRPKAIHSTVLTAEEETMIVARGVSTPHAAAAG
jgi:hypothetical protein